MLLSRLLKQQSRSLSDESSITLMAGVESIANWRTLTVEIINHIGSEAPLSPVNLITMKSNVASPPPLDFKQPHLHSRQRWKGIQHIAEWFWCRWQEEVFAKLQYIAKC